MFSFLTKNVGLRDQAALQMARQFNSVEFDIDNFDQENAISLICKMAPLIEAHTIEHKDIMKLLNYMKGLYHWPEFYSNAEHFRPIRPPLNANGNQYLV
jgi:hypothetical protein